MLTAGQIGWMALGTGSVAVLAITAAIVIGFRTWRDWQRVRLTQDVAIQLVDTHAARLQSSVDQAADHVGTIADDGEQLAEHVAELRQDVEHLRWMLGTIPDARERLTRELLNLMFWTRTHSRPTAEAARDA